MDQRPSKRGRRWRLSEFARPRAPARPGILCSGSRGRMGSRRGVAGRGHRDSRRCALPPVERAVRPRVPHCRLQRLDETQCAIPRRCRQGAASHAPDNHLLQHRCQAHPCIHRPRLQGLGSDPPAARQRGAGRQSVTYGLPRRPWQDLYHLFMTMSWPRLFASYAGFFIVFNLIFAAVYQLRPNDVANLSPAGYWGRFFFSVETLATVGYGDMHPQTVYAHVIAPIEIFTGMMSLALITGMMFALFSRPTARILFARHAVIREFDGRRTLMLRAANERQNVIMEATAQLRLIRDEQTAEGYRIRRIYDLPLRRSRSEERC